MLKILEIVYLRVLRPIFFILAFGLYHAFHATMWLKTPRMDFKKEYKNPYGDVSGLAFVLCVIFICVILIKLYMLILFK